MTPPPATPPGTGGPPPGTGTPGRSPAGTPGRHRRGPRGLAAGLAVLATLGVLASGITALAAGGAHRRARIGTMAPAGAPSGGSSGPAAAGTPPGGPALTGRPAPSRTAPARRAARSTVRPSPTPPTTGPEARVLALVNRERAKAGCGALAADARLASAARAHSADMAGRGYFDHVTPDGVDPGARITRAGYAWSAYGENIAMGQPDPASVMAAWMNSSGHRANILDCGFRDLGVGLAYDPRHRPYWTQDFGTPR